MGVSLESTLLLEVFLDVVGVEALRIVDGRVVLNDGCDDTAIAMEELGGPVADITETLDNESPVLKSLGKAELLVESWI